MQETGYVISLKETSASWSGARSWCSSYGDGKWYLPTEDQLKDIYNQKSTLNNTLSTCGGTTLGTSYYWSSTEYYNDYGNSNRACAVSFSSGSSSNSDKWNTDQVRAVRAL